MKRAALYLRVSTEEQTTANQLPDLKRIAKQRGLAIVATFTENASAAKARPEFDRLMKGAHAGAFDVVLVWALDRFGRSMVGNLQAVNELDRRGVLLISAREGWLDTTGPHRSLLVGIFSWVAEQERSRLIERTTAGMARARAEGKEIGRPRVIYGTSQVMHLMAKPRASYRTVARELGVSESSVRRAVKRGSAAEAAKTAKTPKKRSPVRRAS